MNHAGGHSSKYNDSDPDDHATACPHRLSRAADRAYGQDFLDSQLTTAATDGSMNMSYVYLVTNSEDNLPEGRKIYTDGDGASGIAIQNMGDAKENYRWTYLLKNNADDDDLTRIIEWAKAMGLRIPHLTPKSATLSTSISGCGRLPSKMSAERGIPSAATWTAQCAVLCPPGRQQGADAATRPRRVLQRKSALCPNNVYLGKLIANPGNAHNYYGHMHDILSTTYNGTYMAHWANNYGQLLPGSDSPAICSSLSSGQINCLPISTPPRAPGQCTVQRDAYKP